MKGQLIAALGTSCRAVYSKDGTNYTVTYNPFRRETINKDDLLRLKLNAPEVYGEYVTVSESRRFNIKVQAADAA